MEVDFPYLFAEVLLDGSSDTEKLGNPWANRYPMKIEFNLLPFDNGDPFSGGQAQITKVEIIDSLGTVRETRTLPQNDLIFTKYVENFWNWNDGFRQPLSEWDGEDARAYGGAYNANTMIQFICDLKYDADGDDIPEPCSVKLYYQDGYTLDPRWGGVVPFNFRVSVTDGTGHKTEQVVFFEVPVAINTVSGNVYYNLATPWVGATVDLYVNSVYVSSTVSLAGGAYSFSGVSSGTVAVTVAVQLSPDGVQSGTNSGVVPPSAVLDIPCSGI